jgi:hypothetical protein
MWSGSNKIVFLLHDLNYSGLGRELMNCRPVCSMLDQFFLARKINATLSVLHRLRNPVRSLLKFSLSLSLPALWWKLRRTAYFDKVVQHRSWTCSRYCCACRRNVGHFLHVKEYPRLLSIPKTEWNRNRIYLMDFGQGEGGDHDSTRGNRV